MLHVNVQTKGFITITCVHGLHVLSVNRVWIAPPLMDVSHLLDAEVPEETFNDFYDHLSDDSDEEDPEEQRVVRPKRRSQPKGTWCKCGKGKLGI